MVKSNCFINVGEWLYDTGRGDYISKTSRKRMMQNREIKVRCPKCGTMPRITNTLRGERFVVSCDCGYIYNCEIY